MKDDQQLLVSIKKAVEKVAPDATVILYGSTARGDDDPYSDIDILILVDKEKLTAQDRIDISYPLYDIEFDTGKLISPLVLTKSDWEKRHRITPFYENVTREGKMI